MTVTDAPLRVVIIDDEPLARIAVESLLHDEPGVEVVGQAGDGPAAIDLIRATHPDLAFLDVQIPGCDGFEVLGALGDDEVPAVIFVTAFDQFALDAFDAHAVDYLLKPFDDNRLRLALERARARLRSAGVPLDPDLRNLLAAVRPAEQYLSRLLARLGERTVVVDLSAVEWIEAADNYVRLHAAGQVYQLRATVRALDQRLDPRQFLRIHRSTIVNIGAVRELTPLFGGEMAVKLAGGAVLAMSRRHHAVLRARLGAAVI